MGMPTLLKLNEVSRRYDAPGGGGGEGVPILKDISLEVAAGESLAVMGPSGSGKSTLLQIIGTLDRPTSGEVFLNGRDLNRLNDLDLARVRNNEIGFVFQAHFLLPQCTVIENVLVPTLAFPQGKSSDGKAGADADKAIAKKEQVKVRAKRLLNRVGLGARLDHRPGQLSGGECQRVAVVRALINQPTLLLADEPTGSLDHQAAQKLSELLVELNREEGVALIVVTHAKDLAERMQKVKRLEEGRLV
jgi:ABC-type lipoprotein export system ATPase subunit